MELFLALSLPIQLALIIIIPVLLVIIILFGKVSFCIGNTKVKFGEGKKNCKECYMVIRAKSLIADKNISKTENNNLKSKMNFSEQQLLTIHRKLYLAYIKFLADNKNTETEERIEIESDIYHTKLRDLLFNHIKNELRRAFKQNNFHQLEDEMLDNYMETEIRLIMNVYYEYMRYNYPKNLIISHEELEKILETEIAEIKETFKIIFRRAKIIEITTLEQVKNLYETCEKEINQYILTV